MNQVEGNVVRKRYNVSEEATKGAMRGAHISIRASRWRLINAMGEEYLVPAHHLDVIVIRANRKSKLYFSGPYDPHNSAPPTCFSDNGIGPSSNALQPQSERCLPCPWNQMNSKINPETGKGSKACSDRTKLAVVIPGDSAVNVYELQVPAKSIKPLNDYINFLRQQEGKPDISDLVTRLEFEDSASHPQIKFSPVSWVREDPSDVRKIDMIYDQRLDEDVIGLNDVPADPELVRQAQQLRLQGPQAAAPVSPQFQLPPQAAPPDPYVQEPAPARGPGRPRKPPAAAPALPQPAPVQGSPGAVTAAQPVRTAEAHPLDIPEFMRRTPAPGPAPEPAPGPVQFGMANAPQPPPNVSAALDTAMRMPPRR